MLGEFLEGLLTMGEAAQCVINMGAQVGKTFE